MHGPRNDSIDDPRPHQRPRLLPLTLQALEDEVTEVQELPDFDFTFYEADTLPYWNDF